MRGRSPSAPVLLVRWLHAGVLSPFSKSCADLSPLLGSGVRGTHGPSPPTPAPGLSQGRLHRPPCTLSRMTLGFLAQLIFNSSHAKQAPSFHKWYSASFPQGRPSSPLLSPIHRGSALPPTRQPPHGDLGALLTEASLLHGPPASSVGAVAKWRADTQRNEVKGAASEELEGTQDGRRNSEGKDRRRRERARARAVSKSDYPPQARRGVDSREGAKCGDRPGGRRL